MVRLWGRTLVRAFRIRVETKIAPDLDFSGSYVYMSNHLSQADIPVLMEAIPAGLSFISKDTLGKIPFLGWSMKLVGMVFIKRGKSQEAIDSINRAAKDTPPDMNFLIFPEGTRSDTGERKLNPIKKGGFHMALASGRDIVPVAVIGTHRIMPKGRSGIFSGDCEVRLGLPIPVTEESSLDELMVQYRSAMEDLLEVPLVERAETKDTVLASQ